MKKPRKSKKDHNYKDIANFLFETGMLAKTPRSGFFFLGSGEQSVAEHVNRVCYIGFVLANLAEANEDRVLSMCLFHDISEARISDLNYVHQKYTERKEHEAVNDLVSKLPFGNKISSIIDEYEKRESLEAKLAKDADNIELLLCLKEQVDIGNTRAKTWIPPLLGRLKTKEGQNLAKSIMETESDEWWYGEKEDEWWVGRNKK